jgi:DNA modification methylase
MNEILFGDNRDTMKQLAAQGVKVQTCVTSPPYYGLRDYGTATYEGGDPDCEHTISAYSDNLKPDCDRPERDGEKRKQCIKCGATRVDDQIGLEETPEKYIENMVDVFRHVRDILADDGTLWVNLGDSYYNYRPGANAYVKQTVASNMQDLPKESAKRSQKLQGLKEKDLIGIPWMFAFAMRADGWYLRQDIIWHKPNPMPESVKDRCTKAHEYIFLFSKKPHYYYDDAAIKVPAVTKPVARNKHAEGYQADYAHGDRFSAGERVYGADGMAKKRSVWTVNTKPYRGAHFAVYPEELIEPCIKAGSRVDDIVFDPFMGSGTTAAVAIKHGRKFLGCELNQDYKELQDKRIAEARASVGVVAAEVPTEVAGLFKFE